MIEFDWDERKNIANCKKHGVWFEEDRFILIGYNSSSKLLVVVHCHREPDWAIRIISARKTTKKERVYYEKGI